MITNAQKKALIIGISDYTDPRLKVDGRNLNFCRNDAETMGEELKKLNFDIAEGNMLVGEANWEKVRNTICDFFVDNEDSPDDTLLLYYSGHGVLDDQGNIYLALSDTDSQKPYIRGYSFGDLTMMIERTISTRVVVILDCCYSGSAKIGKGSEEDAVRKWRRIMEERSKNLQQQQRHVKCILAASLSHQEAYALKEEEHSVFTKYLLKGLKGEDNESIDNEGNVTPQSLSNYVYIAIKRLPSNERPHQDPIIITKGSANIILASYPKLKPLKIENTLASMLKLLREGNVQEFNKMRETNSAILLEPVFSMENLHGAHIPGANLSNAKLNQVDLSGADLEGANLSNANLFRADLEGANLSNTNCSNAVLEAAILSHANLTKANLSNVIWHKANLYNANISSEDLQQAKLHGAIYEPPTKTHEAAGRKKISKTKISIAVSLTVVALILATSYLLPSHHNTLLPSHIIGAEPYDISVNRFDNIVYVVNQGSNTVSLIDGKTNTVAANITVGRTPIVVSVNPSTNITYVANRDENTISVIDGKTNTVTDVINGSRLPHSGIAVGDYPFAVSVDPLTNIAYVVNYDGNTVSVIDGKTNIVTATIPVGKNPSAVSVNPLTNIAYVANFDEDTVYVIDCKTNKGIVTIPVGKNPSAVAINLSTNKAYVINHGGNTVSVIDGKTNIVTATIPVGRSHNGLSINPSTNKVHVANRGDNTVSVIDGRTNKGIINMNVGISPSAVSVNPSTNITYVANQGDNTLSVIDGKTLSITSIQVGRTPSAVSVNPSTNIAYVVNRGDNTLSVIDGKTNTLKPIK